MQKILIIGNGFDLHHHLPTKYEHFIDVLQTIEKLNSNFNEYPFSQIFENINDSFKQLIINSYKTESIKFSQKTIQTLQAKIKNNIWYQCFKHIREIDTWIDFETQIEKTLNIVYLFFEKSKTFIESNLSKTYIKVACIDTVSSENGFILNSNQYKILLDLNLILPRTHHEYEDYEGDINEDYLLVEKESIYGINEKLILEDLSNSLDQFIQIFNLYFTDIIEPFYNNYNQLQLIKDIQGENASILTINPSLINIYDNKFKTIYSFNYTSTLKRYYNTREIMYLHGHTGEYQNMVLGVNDINDELKQHKMFAFTKYYQKLYKNTNFNFLDSEIDTNLKTNIYIWGHSLDQSDGEYISKIFSILKRTNNQFKLIIFYHDNLARAFQLQNLLKICGKETIENSMKFGNLIFQESNNENLNKMIKVSQ